MYGKKVLLPATTGGLGMMYFLKTFFTTAGVRAQRSNSAVIWCVNVFSIASSVKYKREGVF
jgi:hypothetical protein